MTSTSTINRWIKYRKTNPQASLRLFCFPYAGGGAQIFRDWSDRLPPTIEVCPVELPGRGSRIAETPFTQLLPLVEAIADGISPLLDRPFAFFGHSMGALISFELARYLRRQQHPGLAHLFVSSRPAPQLTDQDPPTHNLPEAELIKKLRWLKGTPKAVLADPELMQLLLPVLRADFAICETYVYTPEPPLSCPITALGGWRDPATKLGTLQAWRQQTTAAFAKQIFLGNHFFLHSAQSPLLKFLTEKLQAQFEHLKIT